MAERELTVKLNFEPSLEELQRDIKKARRELSKLRQTIFFNRFLINHKKKQGENKQWTSKNIIGNQLRTS
jgi:hypothetical protein